MGLLLSSLRNILMEFIGYKARILMLGLPDAGRTTILYRLKLQETVTTAATIGYNVETLQPFHNITFTVWDLGGHGWIMPLWRLYFPNTDGLIFVVDSTDPETFQEASSLLNTILDEMRGVPFIVLANKQDLPGARQQGEVSKEMELWKMKGHQWHVQGCSGTTGDGLIEGLEIFTGLVKEFKKNKRTMRCMCL